MVEPEPGTKVICQQCFDEVTKVHRTQPRTGFPVDVTIKTHQCPSCRDEMSIYCENGVLMVKCAGCAPEGVPCDKCLRPDALKK